MIPYTRHHIAPADEAAVLAVLRSGRLTQGPQVEALEARMCEIVGTKYCVACSSGTAALWLAYAAAGPQSLTTSSLTFVATTNAYLSAQPHYERLAFMDVDPTTGLVLKWDWPAECAPDCVVPVHLGGQGASTQYPSVIEDATHALGAGFAIGRTSLAACFSFHPAKHVAAGEGGAICTNDGGLWAICVALRDHGCIPGDINVDGSVKTGDNRVMVELGLNFRLDEMSAALALSQLDRLEWSVNARRLIAAQYDEAFHGNVRTVPHRPGSARHLYQLLVDERDRKRQQLAERGVGSQVHYYPVHLQPYYRKRFGYGPGDFPNAEWHAEHTLSIPLFPTMTTEEITTVIRAVLEVCQC